ncbi:MAG: 3-deoxy-D-manno-octulosonic acid transferase [Planctomycetota bacterium]
MKWVRVQSLVIDLAYLLMAPFVIVPWLLLLVVKRRRGVGSLRERLGYLSLPPAAKPRIWLHAVSVGEFEAAWPLIQELTANLPRYELVVSTTTTSAYALARRRVDPSRVFLYPLDFGFAVRRSLRAVRPQLVVLLELELWPNFLLNAAADGVPIVVANGRVSARGFRRMRHARLLVRSMVRRVRQFFAQTDEYRDRLLALGVPGDRIVVNGNLKFDRPPLADRDERRRVFEARCGFPPQSRRWIAGSTHAGEEEIVLAVHHELRAEFADLSLILAPRHHERAAVLVDECARRGFSVARYSATGSPAGAGAPGAPQVVVVDGMGELAGLYACADAAFVGGSLVPVGGHNVLEAIAAGVATAHGPHMGNFAVERRLCAEAGAAVEVASGSDLRAQVAGWLREPARARAQALRGESLLAAHRGAAASTVRALRTLLRVDG